MAICVMFMESNKGLKMIVTIKDGYVDSYAIFGGLDGGIEVEVPDDMGLFENNYSAYKLSEGKLILDENKLSKNVYDVFLNNLRFLRARECFPIINRGTLWYERLTAEQKEELNIWYQAWLDITETKLVPIAPEWLK